MRLHVFLTQKSGAETLGAERALERPECGVDHHVSREGAVGGEAGLAHVTLVVLRPGVGPLVGLEYARRDELTATLVTSEGLLSCGEALN